MASSPASEIVTFAEFEADLRARELRRLGAKVKLPDQSFQVLVMLLEHPGELVTREEIRNRLWPGDTFVDFDHGLNNAVNRLREAIGDSADSPRFVETLPRRGYRFVCATNGIGPPKDDIASKTRPTQQIEGDAISVKTLEIPKTRNYRWLLLAAPTLVALALLIAHKPQTISPSFSKRTFVLPPDGTTFNLIGDSGGAVALSPDGMKVAFVAVNSQGKAVIWVRPLGKLTADAVDGTEGATFPFWSPDGQWLAYFADTKLKKINLNGGPAITLCDAIFGRGGSWNSRGSIIFAPSSHSGIYRVPDSGGVPTQVTTVDTTMHTTHRWPKFLPDGQHFIYLAASHFHDASHNGAYLGSLDAKDNKLIVPTETDATYASGYLFFLRKDVLMAQVFDPESAQLKGEPRPTLERVLYDPGIWKAVFDASGRGMMAYQLGDKLRGTQLRWFDRSGKQLGILGEPTFQWDPRLSPDGRKIAADVNKASYGYGNIWMYDLATGGTIQVTFSKYDNTTPIWSVDGKHIFFAGKRQHYNIYQVDSRGGTAEKLIVEMESDVWPLDQSSDGEFLLYGQGINIGRGRSQLWVYPMQGKISPFRLLEGEAVESDGQFSPDRRWVAYSSNESGQREVYVVPFLGPSTSSEGKTRGTAEKSQVSISGGRQPRWSRNGKELFYLAADYTLMAVSVTGTSSRFNTSRPHPLFRCTPRSEDSYFSYDVSADGSRFIINSALPEVRAPITLVEDWLSDFRK